MIIVTSAQSFTDIDAYAGVISYANLLRLQEKEAIAVLPGILNESITRSIKNISVDFVTEYQFQSSDEFVIIDISEPEYFASLVVNDRIIEIIDHHPGYEEYWARQDVLARIEPIGAACTLVYERWPESGLIANMSKADATLLSAGILDNTLNFGAEITKQRDHDAYNKLIAIGNLDNNWPSQYFTECQSQVIADPINALENDTKIVTFPWEDLPIAISQITIWDSSSILSTIKEALKPERHFINLISVSETKNYIYCDDQMLQHKLEHFLNIKFANGMAVTNRLWLRKEILKAAEYKREKG